VGSTREIRLHGRRLDFDQDVDSADQGILYVHELVE
jgi:hypothetical protein